MGERVGGRFRVWHTDSGADAGGFECELLALEPDRRIVFRWGFVGPGRTDGVYDSLLTITLREAPGDATALTLVHERLDELAAAMPHVAENVGLGWELVLANWPVRPSDEEYRDAQRDGRYFADVSRQWVVANLRRARAASCSGGARTRRSPPSGRTPAPRNSKRVFADHGVLRPLRLVERETASTGAILATYARDPA